MLYIYHACCVSMPLSCKSAACSDSTNDERVRYGGTWKLGRGQVDNSTAHFHHRANGRTMLRAIVYVWISWYVSSSGLDVLCRHSCCCYWLQACKRRMCALQVICQELSVVSYLCAHVPRSLPPACYVCTVAAEQSSGQISALAMHWQMQHLISQL